MTLAQIILFSAGFSLFGLGVIFSINAKKSGIFITIFSVIVLLEVFNPMLLPKMGIGHGNDGMKLDAHALKHPIAQTKPLPKKIQRVHREKVKDTVEKIEKELLAADYLSLGTDAWRDQNYNKAFKFAHQGLSLESDNRVRSSLFVLVGALYEAIDNPKSAEENYQKAIEIDSGYNWPHVKLGNLYAGLQRLEDAENFYIKALDLDPNDAWTHNNLGILYVKLHRYNEAEAAYRAAIELNPKDAWTHNNLGVLYKGLNRFDEAEQAYKQAVTLDPNHVLAKNNLSILHSVWDGEVGTP